MRIRERHGRLRVRSQHDPYEVIHVETEGQLEPGHKLVLNESQVGLGPDLLSVGVVGGLAFL